MESRYLCRAKRNDNGEWVEGFYFCMTHPDGRHTHHFIILLGADLSLGTPIEKIQVEVYPSTICQCTAMPDKNKKLVFEHDIVWDSDERTFYEIIWNQEDMCWNVKDADGYKSNFEECYGSTIEVNGNSFDNPELLEVNCFQNGNS